MISDGFLEAVATATLVEVGVSVFIVVVFGGAFAFFFWKATR